MGGESAGGVLSLKTLYRGLIDIKNPVKTLDGTYGTSIDINTSYKWV